MKANKRPISFLLTLVLITNLGCSLFASGPAANQAGPENTAPAVPTTAGMNQQPTAPAGQETKTVPAQEDAVEDGEATLVPGEYQRPAISLPALGKVAFTADSAAAVALDFIPFGEEMTLSLTDSTGLTWTLRLPPLALDHPETIRMTPLAGLQSDEVPGKLLGGVRLEPDGLQFHDPPVLTVSGPGTEEKLLLLTGGQDGSNMVFTVPGEDTASMMVFHFSAAVANNVTGPATNPVKEAAKNNASVVAKEVRNWLKEHKDITVPEPPSIPIQCVSHANGENTMAEVEMTDKMDQFKKDFYAPELEMINRLLAARKAQELLGLETDPDFSLENRLMGRLTKKVRLLFKLYSKDKDRLKPVAAIAQDVSRRSQILNPDPAADMFFANEIRDWSERALDELLNEIIDKHDYRNVDAAITLARWIALLGRDINLDQLWQKVVGAMTFEFQGTAKIEVYGNQVYTMKATFPVRYDPNSTLLGELRGSGNIETPSYQNADAPEVTIINMTGTEVNLNITKFDACDGAAEIVLDRFNPEIETYQMDKDTAQDIPALKAFWGGLFKHLKKTNVDKMTGASSDMYIFPSDLRNQDANPIEANYEGKAPQSGGKLKGGFEIKLIHRPKKVR